MQLNVFYTLHEKMQNIDIGYFNLTKGIEEAFEEKRGDIQQQVESLQMVKFKTTGGLKKPAALKYGDRLAIGNGRSNSTGSSGPRRITSGEPGVAGAISPPAYQEKPTTDLSRAASTGSNWQAAAKAKAAPPPPKPKPSRFSAMPAAESVTALYDYDAQAEGDLSFKAGEVIAIVSRTDNQNEWWTGKIGIRQGQFPGKSDFSGGLCFPHVMLITS
jgi:amphiphysin